MFFIPAIRNLINPDNFEKGTSSSPIIQMLSLSNGDYRDESDGPIRTKEMYSACSIIGVENTRDNVTLMHGSFVIINCLHNIPSSQYIVHLYMTVKKIFHPTDQLESVFKEDNLLFALSYTKEKMDQEIERVSREMYRAFNGLNEGFQEVSRL